jgi:hypothetical protein
MTRECELQGRILRARHFYLLEGQAWTHSFEIERDAPDLLLHLEQCGG